MHALGAILIIAGFVLGVFGGLTLARREVLIGSDGKVNTNKQLLLSFFTGACALSMVLGFIFFFKG